MRHGKHVICEKPLSVTAAEARKMADAARGASGLNMVAFNYRRCPAVLEAKRLIDEGAIGGILSFRSLYLQDWAMPEGTPWTWRFGAAEAGSGALGDIGSHALDFALFLVGDIESVSAATETIVKSRPRAAPGESFDPTRTRAASKKWRGRCRRHHDRNVAFPERRARDTGGEPLRLGSQEFSDLRDERGEGRHCLQLGTQQRTALLLSR